MVGFGVRGPEQVEDLLAAGADGAIVGSALLEKVRGCEQEAMAVRAAVRDFLSPMVEVCQSATV